MKLFSLVFTVICLCSLELSAQVKEIKSASSANSSSSSKSSGSVSSDDDDDGGGGGGGGWIFEILFGGIAEWQKYKLSQPVENYPSMVSFDVMFQGAVKPSSYYMLWPRVRANWGLFSTDFRMNYLIENGVDGHQHIRTNDWQVLQMNLITSKYITTRVGVGFMQEAFNTNKSFMESSIMFGVHAPDQTKTIEFEYRSSKDFDTDANPRREVTIQYQQEIFKSGALHGYATLGGAYQRYYNSISVWGVQAGLVLRFF